MRAKKKRVVLGITEGRTGLVAAALLKNQDFDVKCVYLKIGNPFVSDDPFFFKKTRETELEKFCKKLDIALSIVDVSGEFEAHVVEPALHARLMGKGCDSRLLWTEDVLFPALEKVRVETKADLISTGHRIRLSLDQKTNQPMVFFGADWKFDECPLISRVSHELLSKTVFPMGEIPDSMMTKLAVELGIDPKPDLENDVPEEIQKTPTEWDSIPESVWKSVWIESKVAANLRQPGPIRTSDHIQVGEHTGIHGYRIGDRSPIDSSQRIFDIQVHPTRALIVGPPEALLKNTFVLSNASFLAPTGSLRLEELSVYTGPETQKARVRVAAYFGGFLTMECETPLRAITAGQTAVFFKENLLVGSAEFTTTSSIEKRNPS